jgi:hypothetical protein
MLVTAALAFRAKICPGTSVNNRPSTAISAYEVRDLTDDVTDVNTVVPPWTPAVII